MINGTIIDVLCLDKNERPYIRKTFLPLNDIKSIYLDQEEDSDNYGYFIIYTSDTSYVTRTNLVPNHNLINEDKSNKKIDKVVYGKKINVKKIDLYA